MTASSRAVALIALLVHGATPFASRGSLRSPGRALPAAARSRVPSCSMVAVTPAIAKARIATQEEQIRHMEKELIALKASVVADKRELRELEVEQAPTFRETTSRSLVKAFGWRLTAGVITFCSSMYFIKNLKTALAIVASDFLSKSFTMFIGERLFNKVNIGRKGGGDSLSRSVVKALIWRAIAFINTALVSGAIIGSAGVGSLIALSDSIFKTSLMVVYDQFWNRIDWGKELENVDGDGI